MPRPRRLATLSRSPSWSPPVPPRVARRRLRPRLGRRVRPVRPPRTRRPERLGTAATTPEADPGPRHERDRLRQGADPVPLPRRQEQPSPVRRIGRSRSPSTTSARDPTKAVATANGAFVWAIRTSAACTSLNVDLPEAGNWGAEFTTEAPGFAGRDRPPDLRGPRFDCRPSRSARRLRHRRRPTAADVGGDLSKISTDTTPDPAFYQTSVADALAAHKPFVLIFATRSSAPASSAARPSTSSSRSPRPIPT